MSPSPALPFWDVCLLSVYSNCVITILLNVFQVYVTKNGQELTGQIAYRHYKKVLPDDIYKLFGCAHR